MRRSMNALVVAVITIALSFPVSTSAQKTKNIRSRKALSTSGLTATLWEEPKDIATRNLFYGSGGKEHLPQGKLTFIKEDDTGSNPKFEVKDEQGTKWKVKLGPEAQSETAATRLVWAAGYFTDETYYLPELRVEGLKPLKRGHRFVSVNGTIQGARLERDLKGEKKIGNWSWFDNPFAGTKELNGLKVMMALINNWDLKTANNGIYDGRGGEPRYVITDLGASFGKTGNSFSRSRNRLDDYLDSKFIKKVKSEEVDFVLHSRPFFLYAIWVPYYFQRTKMEKIGKNIPRDHAKWIGQLLGQLSEQQISDAFRAAGYSPSEVKAFTQKVRDRIGELNDL